MTDLIRVYCILFDRFFRLNSHFLHFLDLLHIFLQSILLLLLDFLILHLVKLIEMLIVRRSCLNSLCLLSFLYGEFLLDGHLVGHELRRNVALVRCLLLGCIVLLGGGQVSVLLVALELLFKLGIVLSSLLGDEILSIFALLLRILQNLHRRLLGLLCTLGAALFFSRLSVVDFSFQQHRITLALLSNVLVLLGLLLLKLFVPGVTVCLVLLSLFCHLLLELLFVVLLGHLTIQNELLVKGISKSDLGR